jgi:hypothetical protein
MIAILKIGITAFAFRKTSAATKILELLSEAQPVEYKYRADCSGCVYFPDRPDRIRRSAPSIEMVPEAALLPAEPADDQPLPEETPRRRGRLLPAPR